MQNFRVIARPFRAVAIPKITGGFPRSRCSLGMTNGSAPSGPSWAPPPTKGNTKTSVSLRGPSGPWQSPNNRGIPTVALLPRNDKWERAKRGVVGAAPYERKHQNIRVIARPFRAVAIPKITGGFPRSRCSLGMTYGSAPSGASWAPPPTKGNPKTTVSLRGPFGPWQSPK